MSQVIYFMVHILKDDVLRVLDFAVDTPKK